MKPKKSLKTIFIISIIGILFSGWLSYKELFLGACPDEGCAMIFDLPVCVYGLIMYILIFVIALLGLRGRK